MPKNDADVIIIGAGISGLAAARELSAKGLRLIILEARDRIGGRILTQHQPGAPVPLELGAEFVHGRPPEIWDLLKPAGLAVAEGGDNHLNLRDGKLYSYDQFWEVLENIDKRMRRERNRDISFKDFLAKQKRGPRTSEAVEMITAYIEGFHASRIDKISLAGIIRSDDASNDVEGDQLFRPANGYDKLPHWFRDGLDPDRTQIVLNTEVKTIRWRRGHVEVETTSSAGLIQKTFTATKALITLPLGILKAPSHAPGAVRFDPELSEKRDAAWRLEMGAVVRVILQFDKPFWEDVPQPKDVNMQQLSFMHAPREPFLAWWTPHPLKIPQLTGWSGGSAAEEMSNLGGKEILRRAIKSLSTILDVRHRKIEHLITSWHFHDWANDPYARGAYSYVPVGGTDAPKKLSRPIQNTLFFAGEATDLEGHNGTVHGAIRTGHRAAKEMLKA